jgi:hypothetical protein
MPMQKRFSIVLCLALAAASNERISTTILPRIKICGFAG